MSYDLGVWEGPKPASDDAAMSLYEELMDRYHSADAPGSVPVTQPPTPAILAFVEALLDRWPDITNEGGEDSPWADGPMIENASGPIIYFGMMASGLKEAVPFVIDEARRRGLVCFDPQGPPYLL